MNRRETVLALLALGSAPLDSLAQQPVKVWRIGVLETTSMAQNAANLTAFLKGMQELGYVEGRNFVIDYRSSDGRNERFPDLATELIRGKVDLIVTRGTPATLASRKATTTIPVVTIATAVPLMFAATLARPGGNVTGLSSFNVDLLGKRVQLLNEIVPGIARLAYLVNKSNPTGSWNELERVARSLGIQPLLLEVQKREDIRPAFVQAARQRINGLYVTQDGFTQAHGKLIVELAAKHRLPAIYQASEYVDDGGLFSYGVSYPDLYRRAAAYVDKILKGARPSDLPMELPTKFELVVNLKTAKALGITIPQSLLLRADRVIE
jgi:putative ABC transport system substrate-binding protein